MVSAMLASQLSARASRVTTHRMPGEKDRQDPRARMLKHLIYTGHGKGQRPSI